MTPQARPDFDTALDVLANTLRATPLNTAGKDGYFRALESHSFDMFIEAMKHLAATYTPRWRDDFPSPAVIAQAINISVDANRGASPSEAAELFESFERRGFVVGEEAVRKLEEVRQERQDASPLTREG